MRIITSPGGAVAPMQPAQGIRDLKNAGFEHVLFDLGMFCQIENLWPDKRKLPGDALRNPETIRRGYETMLKVCGEVGMDLPKGCGVFICNIYYREIERQLRKMGVKNIEYFNNEYMPLFDMDRLEWVFDEQNAVPRAQKCLF